MNADSGITVLMSVYNDAEYIPYAIKSILNQTYKEFEFLIIDDGSTDETEEIIHAYKDSRIVYKRISHRGLAGALNFGMKISSYSWIARIDADDMNSADRLSVQSDFTKWNPGYDVISSWSVYFKNKNKIQFFIKTPEDDEGIKKFLNLHNPINHSSVLFRKNKIMDEKGYDRNLDCYEDFELWFRLRNKLRFRILPQFLVYTRLRPNSLTSGKSKNKIYKMLMDNAEININKFPDRKSTSYWSNLLFWIEYFYGDKSKARKYLTKDFTVKKAIASLNSLLPEQAFRNITGLRLKYRLQSKLIGQNKYKKELNNLAE